MNRAMIVAALVGWGTAAGAQSIRGTVIDEGSRAPIPGVLVTMINGSDVAAGDGVRTDSVGNFVVHAPRAGTWRVRTSRIGYAPATSPPVELAIGQLAVVRLRLTTIAQPLAAVQVVERRQYTAAELMSTTGFDLRERRGQGAFLSGERLKSMGIDGLREVLALHLQPRLLVYIDPVVGEVLMMREGVRLCPPEIFLDGRLLATAPEKSVIVDTNTAQTAMDTLMGRLRAESEYSRRMYQQVVALNTLAGLTAGEIHGVEVYRANEVPPTSLGAWFGMTKETVRTCGTVAVWTKAGALSVVNTVKPNSSMMKPLQVISGVLLDFETGLPVADREVALLDEDLEDIGRPARTNDLGEFVIRTGRAGAMRLQAGDTAYRTSTSPVIDVATNELVLVKLYVSTRTPILAPLAVASRVLPHMIGLSSRAGFTYRRERAQAGVFIRGEDFASARYRTLIDALRPIEGVDASGPTIDALVFREGNKRQSCRPTYYVDGVVSAAEAAAALPLDQLLGVEVYTRPSLAPVAFSEGGNCGVIALWTMG